MFEAVSHDSDMEYAMVDATNVRAPSFELLTRPLNQLSDPAAYVAAIAKAPQAVVRAMAGANGATTCPCPKGAKNQQRE